MSTKAKVNINVEILDGIDAGYVIKDSTIVPLIEHAPDGLIHPHKIAYSFMTPEMQLKLHTLALSEDVGFEDSNLSSASEVIDMLKIILESSEPIQIPDSIGCGFGTLVKDVKHEGSFDWVIESAIKLLEKVYG